MAQETTPAERNAAARAQFARAESAREILESKPERQRSLNEYSRVASAYRRVYLITAHAAQVPAAIKHSGDLYARMGKQFEASYYRQALAAYELLVRGYPASSLRPEAQLAIAIIQRELNQPELAKKSYEEFLKNYPRSSLATQARAALAAMSAEQQPASRRSTPALVPAAATRRDTLGTTPAIDQLPGSGIGPIRVWNADNYTRIVIDLGAQAKYQAARISGPDRIYFDIENSQLNPSSANGGSIDIPQSGYLKAVRMAQNRPNVVRVVLEVEKVKDYSVFELANPDRLVIDVYGEGEPEQNARTRASNTAPPLPDSRAKAASRATSVAAAATSEAIRTSGTAAPVTGQANTAATLATKPTAAKQPPLMPAKTTAASMGPAPIAQPTRGGTRSLTRVLGLKVGRIVIDPGHGGHDTGTIGRAGLMEKDLSLDVALRLGRLIQERLPSAEVTYTRNDDSYVSLEQRTELANEARADLLISIHANSSRDRRVRGIETYYLHFDASPAAMEVAARENALSQAGVHELEELVQKIARNDKMEESRDFAAGIQEALVKQASSSDQDRGVRKAPFVVLIGAQMPSVLTEISFLSNPSEEQRLKKPENRQRIAEGLYRGVENYLKRTNSLAGRVTPEERANASQR
jgi:N-acetylmuramoyl-L-alanine amidase